MWIRRIRLTARFALTLSAGALFAESGSASATERERALLERIAKLEERLSALEAKFPSPAPEHPETAGPTVSASSPTSTALPEWLKDTTVNFHFDGYYLWNTNRPPGRVNLLRAYDVTANNFSLNQTGMIIEKSPSIEAGRRWGYRLDILYGQATETLQGGAQNEPRPQVYRPVFQAYGTYVLPVGRGLAVDFGKWASALGYEYNYTKDQINYSRSYFFNFLPFYHMGFRATYSVNDKLSVAYWLVNGGNQTEDFNGFKTQHAQAVIKPTKNSSWTLNYFAGREQRDLVPALNPGLPTAPTQPGLSITRLVPTPLGRLHVVDTYAQVRPTDKLTLVGAFDYVINRLQPDSPPKRIVGGSAYLKYQFTPTFYFGQRYVRLNDHAGLFSGAAQNLNDLTSTFGYRLAGGFETRLEYRRDFSNTPFFPAADSGRLMKSQETIAVGLLWWFGGKQGVW